MDLAGNEVDKQVEKEMQVDDQKEVKQQPFNFRYKSMDSAFFRGLPLENIADAHHAGNHIDKKVDDQKEVKQQPFNFRYKNMNSALAKKLLE